MHHLDLPAQKLTHRPQGFPDTLQTRTGAGERNILGTGSGTKIMKSENDEIACLSFPSPHPKT